MGGAGDAGKLKLESGVKLWRRIKKQNPSAGNGLRWYEMARDGEWMGRMEMTVKKGATLYGNPYINRPRTYDGYFLFSLQLLCFASATTMMITNIYAITAIAVIGGSLFGFDLSSMSAM